MTASEIVSIVIPIVAFLVGAIPTVTALVVAIKKYRHSSKALESASDEAATAKLEAERAEAVNDMTNALQRLIEQTEVLYADVASQLKSNGKSAAAVKKDSAMVKLQAYALTKGYEFDEEYWSEQLDNMVNMTKIVNAK